MRFLVNSPRLVEEYAQTVVNFTRIPHTLSRDPRDGSYVIEAGRSLKGGMTFTPTTAAPCDGWDVPSFQRLKTAVTKLNRVLLRLSEAADQLDQLELDGAELCGVTFRSTVELVIHLMDMGLAAHPAPEPGVFGAKETPEPAPSQLKKVPIPQDSATMEVRRDGMHLRWIVCPTCQARRDAAAMTYGKVPLKQFLEDAVPVLSVKAVHTLREDYQIGLQQGVLHVDYAAVCSACGFSLSYSGIPGGERDAPYQKTGL